MSGFWAFFQWVLLGVGYNKEALVYMIFTAKYNKPQGSHPFLNKKFKDFS